MQQQSVSRFRSFLITSGRLLLIVPAAIITGSFTALFLFLLDKVTHLRWQNEYLLFLLPLAGVLIQYSYLKFGKTSTKGNDLIIDEIHKPGGGVPKRMLPFVFISTIITHLFGGSAGREGTAVQMGGSIFGTFNSVFKLPRHESRLLLMSGIAAGFGAVFGTPAAGAVFAIEVLTIGKTRYGALFPCLMASIIGDFTCSAWGIHHTTYSISFQQSAAVFSYENILLLLKVFIASALFGLAGFFFAETTHGLRRQFNKYIKSPFLIPVIGGLIIIGLTFLLGTTDYNGIGVTSKNTGGVSIVNAFNAGGANTWSWFWKLLFTAITLSAGFKGGEVTPLFFIGATLGNTLAILLNAPIDLFAGLGFIAVFAGATNTPIACTIMGIELFGGQNVLYFTVACFTAYIFSGHSGIYASQKIGSPKPFSRRFANEHSLRESSERRNAQIADLKRKFVKKRSS